MRETFKMMQSILTGKEKDTEEKILIQQYKENLSPNVLAYFYCNNFSILNNISKSYPNLTNDDKASFCLQEMDKCLQKFNLNQNIKFITYFIKCYKNRLKTEIYLIDRQKRRTILHSEDLSNRNLFASNDIEISDIDIILNNYNLNSDEKIQCKLLNSGYSLKEIAKCLKKADITIWKRNSIIKKKILNSYIDFA